MSSFRNQMQQGRSALDSLNRLSTGDDSTVVALSNIRVDGGTQPRAELDEQLVAEYADEMLAGTEFPAVDLVYDGQDYWLVDGFHRVAAAKRAQSASIKAIVESGTRRDAVLRSVGVNAAHGKRRSNADKRRAVLTLLADEEWSQWSDNRIAQQCKVSNRFVGNLRQTLSLNGSKMDDDQPEAAVERLAETANIKPEIVARAQENVQQREAAGARRVERGGQVYEQQVGGDARREAAQQRQQSDGGSRMANLRNYLYASTAARLKSLIVMGYILADELPTLRGLEVEGQNRKSVIEMIEGEMRTPQQQAPPAPAPAPKPAAQQRQEREAVRQKMDALLDEMDRPNGDEGSASPTVFVVRDEYDMQDLAGYLRDLLRDGAGARVEVTEIE